MQIAIALFSNFLPKTCESSIYWSDHCTQYEIIDIIDEFANGKSSDIPIHVIKKSAKIISPFLAKHFNHCMQQGICSQINLN